MQITLSARSVVASASLVGLGMLASPHFAQQDPHRDVLARIAAQDAKIAKLQARLAAHEAVLTPENGVKLMKMLPHMRVVEEAGPDGSTLRTIVFEEVNVQIVNGLGATNGTPDDPVALSGVTNFLGNLIVGYNEPPLFGYPPTLGDPFDRSGSHNVIVGIQNQYSSFGGIVAGQQNTIEGAYSSVTGGAVNLVSGDLASVSGGVSGQAVGVASWVGGGHANIASGDHSSVSGGSNNTATGRTASVSGGQLNTATGGGSSVSGGENNLASGALSSVSGGNGSTASARATSVSGGFANVASGNGSVVSGGNGNTASGVVSAVSGGEMNVATGVYSSVTGGQGNTAGGDPTRLPGHTSVNGGMNNLANAAHATVSGGIGVTVSAPGGHQ